MDIQLPGRDGFKTLTLLCETSETHRTDVVAPSPAAMPRHKQRCGEGAVSGIVQSPEHPGVRTALNGTMRSVAA